MNSIETRRHKRVKKLYRKIKEANSQLQIIRRFCQHTETEKVNYEMRIGAVYEGTTVCVICGEVIEYLPLATVTESET